MADTALKCEQVARVRQRGEKPGIPHRIMAIEFG